MFSSNVALMKQRWSPTGSGVKQFVMSAPCYPPNADETLLKAVCGFAGEGVHDPMMATGMPAAISPYSMAVAPLSCPAEASYLAELRGSFPCGLVLIDVARITRHAGGQPD